MDDIEFFAKKRKRIGNPNTGSENINSRYREEILYRKMCHVNNEKREATYDGKNGTTVTWSTTERREIRDFPLPLRVWIKRPSKIDR